MTPNDHSVTLWEPAELLKPKGDTKYAAIFLNQPIENLGLLQAIWEDAEIRIAADGGGNRLHDAMAASAVISKLVSTTKLDVICGDLDSISASVMSQFHAGGTTISKDGDQYSTDFTKCYKYARQHCASPCDIVCIGGLGGRVDQALATLNHLYVLQETYDKGMMYLLSTEAITFVLKPGKHRIRVKDSAKILGRNIGIIPKAPCDITTTGLEWDVEKWRTEWGGQISTSNYVREEYVTVETDGDVLFTIDYDLAGGAQESGTT